MRKAVVMPFLISFVLMSAGLVVGASRLKPQAHFSAGSIDKTLLTSTTGTGCVSCHTGTGFTAAFTSSTSTAGITSTQLYPGETGNFTIRATTTSTAAAQYMGTNIAATGGTLSVTDPYLIMTTSTNAALSPQIQHHSTTTPPTLKTVVAGSPNFYAFSYTLTSTAAIPATTSIAGVAIVDYVGGGQHAPSIAVTSHRPTDPFGAAPGTATSTTIPLTWGGTGPAYRVIAKPGAVYPTGPTDTAGAVVDDVSSTSDTISGLTPSTTYSIGVWGRATFSPYQTFSTSPSQASKTTAGIAVRTWYVNSTTGNDSGVNDGSSGAPFKSITHANGVALSGDTILVAPGNYTPASGEVFPIVLKSGVMLQSSNGAASTIVDATTANPRARVFECSGNIAGTLIQGLTITGGLFQPTDGSQAWGGGIFCDSNDNTRISRNIIKGNQAVGQAGTSNVPAGLPASGGGIWSSGSNRIENNVFRDNIAHGGNGAAATATSPSGNGSDATGGGLRGADTAINNTFYNNLAKGGDGGANLGADPGGLAGAGQAGGLYTTSIITNNIFANNTAASGTPGGSQPPNTTSANGGQSAGGTLDHNLFFGSTPSFDVTGSNAVTGQDPKFVSTSDLHLTSTSPAKGAGTATNAPTVDLDGTTRPNPPSIGAYEVGGGLKVPMDFNGDSKSDIVLQNTDGSIAEWLMNGVTLTSGVVIGNPGSTWVVRLTGDFNGDGKADLILQNSSTGDIAEWQLNGGVITGGAVIANPGTAWVPVAAGDFDGDGKTDILLQNTSTGAVAGWLLNGFTVTAGAIVGTPGTVWQVKATGDFNADHKSDIILQNSSTGEIAEWQMNGLTISAGLVIGGPGVGWSIRAAGDCNGDGKADILIQNVSTGDIAEWQMNGNVIVAGAVVGSPGSAWVLQGSADYNGDGHADILLRTSSGDLAEWQLNGFGIIAGALVGSPGSAWTPIVK